MTLFGQITGAIALGLGVGSYLMRNRIALTITAALGVLFWAVHFAVQGVRTASLLSVIMAVRIAAGVYVVEFSPTARWSITALAWVVTWAGAYLTWQGWVSVPSTIATTFLAFAGFHLHYTDLRKALLFGEVLWFINGLVAQSELAMIASVVSFCLNLKVLFSERTPRPA
jgi:hypothetical protein